MAADPVLEALGMSTAAVEQDWASWHQASPYNYAVHDPATAAWCQAQAMITTAYQLQQMANWQAQAAYQASYATPVAPAATTPRTTPPAALEATPTKAGTPEKPGAVASDKSTEPGSPGPLSPGGDTVASEQEVQVQSLQDIAAPPVPPPPPTPTKLDLHAIIFEKAKDPVSAHLLDLIKNPANNTQGQEKGKEILGLLHDRQLAPKPPPRNGPLTSGSHRRAAAAARAAAAETEAAAEAEAEKPRRRPRGGRGSRGGRGN